MRTAPTPNRRGEACLARGWRFGGPGMPGPYGSEIASDGTRNDLCGPYRRAMQPERPTMRLRGYDYARAGFYFVTLCTHERAPLFGRLCDGEMYSNDVGEIVRCCWRTIPAHHNRVFLDEFVLMPDHVHGVLGLGIDGNPLDGRDGDGDGRARHASPLLGTVVGSFKAAAARLINLHRGTPGATVWQRGYHEHIVKNEGDLRRIREYIAMNPSMSRM